MDNVMRTEVTIEDLQRVEKAIKAASELRQEATVKKEMWGKQLQEKDEELKNLGTTAEGAVKEIEDIDKRLSEGLAQLEKMIPMDLLRKRGKIQ